MRKHFWAAAFISFLLSGASPSAGQTPEFQALQAHLERKVTARFDALFHGIATVPQWEERKRQTRAALEKMLWNDLRWPALPPPASITGRDERREYTIENLVLETLPGLHSTANLYLPRSGRSPFPVILYQCGHANKNRFTHHGAWFAARGIAVLIMDNIEMGEIEFTHHGVYSNAWFHWYSRGFSPMAVELLNARRALDYLCTRKDLDSSRIGATGVSGGGMATFFLSAVDERVKAAAPVAGSLSTPGWIRQRLSAAHCDCQYPVNSYGLLYSEVGALTAPRAQLICNGDADRGFPMDAINEMAGKMREIYRLYKAEDRLGLAVVQGGHGDYEAIRLPVYAFFLKEFLGLDTPVTSQGPVDLPEAEKLVCFVDGLPLEDRLTRIDEELMPARVLSPGTASPQARERRLEELRGLLRHEVFRDLPKEGARFAPEWSEPVTSQGRAVRKVSFHSYDDLRVRGVYSLPAKSSGGARLPAVLVVDHRKGIPVWGNEQPLERNQWGDRAVLIVETLDRGSRALEQNLRSFSDDDPLHHMKRQAMVAGTTLESMQVYEVLRSLAFLRSLPEVDAGRITVAGKGEAGVNGLYAALLDGEVGRVVLGTPPASHRQGPTYLNILRYTDIPEAVALMGAQVKLYGEIPPALETYLAKAGSGESRPGTTLAECLR